MVPDVDYNKAYLSFAFTHPEWRNAGIAKFMIYHLIQVRKLAPTTYQYTGQHNIRSFSLPDMYGKGCDIACVGFKPRNDHVPKVWIQATRIYTGFL